VLLLVIETENRERGDAFVILAAFDELEHPRVDVRTILEDLVHARSGQEPAFGARVHRPHGLVIGVEQIFVLRMKGAITRNAGAQQKLLEEPRRMREMPLRWTRIGHALHDEVLRLERFDEREGRGADALVARDQRCPGMQTRLSGRLNCCHRALLLDVSCVSSGNADGAKRSRGGKSCRPGVIKRGLTSEDSRKMLSQQGVAIMGPCGFPRRLIPRDWNRRLLSDTDRAVHAFP